MRDAQASAIHLRDYRPPDFLVDAVDIDIELRTDDAMVRARLDLRRNPAAGGADAPLVLDGESLALESLLIDGRPAGAGDYTLSPGALSLLRLPDACRVETVSRIAPQKNKALEGLYATRSGFVTQCEAQGFRRITWFIDRPDVMARYRTTIHADRAAHPILLANGNRVAAGDEPGGRHFATFDDPHPKPSYLFAMVAARLDALEDRFVTRSGRSVALGVYVEPGKLDQARWAMDCLQRAMRWDEARFGLECDLDHYAIVAVGDFNSGAMENKGLNIFNARYVLARPDTATDSDYAGIDRVVAHEYFHNWTGNRVTCRDWFQLSLKEGLTVFRDQEYGADHYSRAVTRIQEVRGLRASQFPEDAGPMAHPVRPQSYVEIRNFYTATVYEKGAEVVRMQHTLLGEARFQAGMRLYFQRHDGAAVTCDDFVRAMQDASGVDLTRFMRWYDVAGTPVLECEGAWDAAARRYTLTMRQSMRPPFHVPVAVGLVGPQGEELLEGGTQVLSLREAEQHFSFDGVAVPPVPSLLRGFSAPVILHYAYRDAELAHLMAHDSDPFNRWEAGQRLAAQLVLAGGGASGVYLDACRRVLAAARDNPAFAAEALGTPSEAFLAEQMREVDPDALHAARNRLRAEVAQALHAELLATYHALTVATPYTPDPASIGRRQLRNSVLSFLMESPTAECTALCTAQFERADNMTDAFAALAALAQHDGPAREAALAAFYARWKSEDLVVDKWLAVQAASRLPDTLARVRGLLAHPAFDLKVPNKVYALIRSFAANHVRFHAADGEGYRFIADQVIALDAFNAQVAARMARSYDRWTRFDAGRQAAARRELERIRGVPGLSPDVGEIVGRALA